MDLSREPSFEKVCEPLAYGKTTTFSTNFDFITTAQKLFVFIVTK